MAAQSLVLCRDPETLGSLKPLLERLGFGTQVCQAQESAQRLVTQRRFDAVIAECDERAGGFDLLRVVRQAPVNRDTVTVGIVPDPRQGQYALEIGANFVLSKPVPLEDARRILQAVKGTAASAVRRSLRLPVGTLAYAWLEGLPEKTMMLDLGEGGLSIQAFEKLNTGRRVRLRFELPGTGARLETRGEIVWADASGRAGIQFHELGEMARRQIQRWVSNSLAVADEEGEKLALPWQHRALAEAVDLGAVTAATAVFGGVAVQIVRPLPPVEWMAGFGGALLFFFWTIYRYLYFLHAAERPGMAAARKMLK